MKNITSIVMSLVLILTLSSCGDECTEYSDFTCDEIEEATYNAYFYFPDNREYYLGVANSLSQCGAMAHNFAASKDLTRNSGWGYICCMKAKGSECYEKHR